MPANRGGKGRPTRNSNVPLVAPYTPQRRSGRPIQPPRRIRDAIPSSPPSRPKTPTEEPRLPELPPPPPKRTDKSGLLAKERLSAKQQLELRRKNPIQQDHSRNGIVADVGVQPRTELARKVRESYQEALNRKGETADRVRARLAKEEAEWQAEIAEFGEPEARRRRQEERETMAEYGNLPTSDLEYMEMEEERSNPKLHIHSTLRVDKKFEWQATLPERNLQDFSLADFEQVLNEEIEKRDGWTKGWVLTHRTAFVKGAHHKAKKIPQSIDDFTESEWDKVLNIILKESTTYGGEVDLKIEIQAETTKQVPVPPKLASKRQHVELSSDAAEPLPQEKKRVTRTDKLLDSARDRAEALEAVGNYDKKLLDRWQCRDQECRNLNGFCFIDFEGKHFDIDSIQQLRWGKAIARGDLGVSIERPPTEIYKSWQKQGPCESISRRTKVYEERQNARAEREEGKDFMNQFMEFNKKAMEMRLQETMADSLERMTSRQRPQAIQPPPTAPTWPQMPTFPSYPPHPPAPWSTQMPYQYSYWPSASSPPPALPVPPIPPTFPTLPIQPVPPGAPAVPLAPPTQSAQIPQIPPPTGPRSSPFGASEEEATILDQFFQWKIGQTTKPELQARIAEAKTIVERECWSIDDLKEMADPSSFMYSTGVKSGLPEGMARSFKMDLRLFKPQWKEVQPLLGLSNI